METMRSISIFAIFVAAIISTVSANAYKGGQVAEIINEICIGNIYLQDNMVVYKNSSTIENGIIRKFYEL